MKKNNEIQISKESLEILGLIIATAEKMKNSYFWKSPSFAAQRRRYEKQYTFDEIAWSEGGNEYTAKYTVTCSCRNIYASGHYTKNGNETTLTAIRNSYKRMTENK